MKLMNAQMKNEAGKSAATGFVRVAVLTAGIATLGTLSMCGGQKSSPVSPITPGDTTRTDTTTKIKTNVNLGSGVPLQCGSTAKACVTPTTLKLFGDAPITMDSTGNIVVVRTDGSVYTSLQLPPNGIDTVDLGLYSVSVSRDSVSDSAKTATLTVTALCNGPQSCQSTSASLDCNRSSMKTGKLLLGQTIDIGQFPMVISGVDVLAKALAKAGMAALAKAAAGNPTVAVTLSFLRNDCSTAAIAVIGAGKTDTVNVGIQHLVVSVDSAGLVAWSPRDSNNVRQPSTIDSSFAYLTVQRPCQQ